MTNKNLTNKAIIDRAIVEALGLIWLISCDDGRVVVEDHHHAK